jgi:hypothetical protein
MDFSSEKFIQSFFFNLSVASNSYYRGRDSDITIPCPFSCVCAREILTLFSAADLKDNIQTYGMCVLDSRTSLYGIHDSSSDV